MIAEPPPNAFPTEILEQPEAIRRAGGALEEQVPSLDRVAERSANASLVVLTGMGSSYDACLGLANILGRSGVMAVTVKTAELVHFRFSALGRECLVVAVSQSGESAEVVRLAERMRSAKGASGSLVAVTNGRGNPLADMADETIDTVAGTETGPSTETFGTSLVALSVLARLATGGATVARTTTDVRGDAKRASLEAERLLEDATTGASELLAWSLALASGRTPGVFSRASKVTSTE